MTRPRRQPAKAQRPQLAAHRGLAHRQAELLLEPQGNWLSNRVFKSYDDILDHCCNAWNRLVDQLWRIMSIGMREWAHWS